MCMEDLESTVRHVKIIINNFNFKLKRGWCVQTEIDV